jgi:putative transposase
VVYRFIDKYKIEFGLRWLFRKFNLSPNAYYNYLKNRKADYHEEKFKVQEAIKSIYYNNGRIIGHRWMVIFLARQNIFISKTTAHKYMNKELDLHAITMRKRPRYVKGEKNKVFPNLLNQNFSVPRKNKVWCTDFTYIRMANGKMHYNCSIIDLYKREAVATINSKWINSDLAIETLTKAIEREKPGKGLILHSDQGVQFTSWAFVEYCENQGIVQSMSKTGCPYDNAPMERFYKSFKTELIYPNKFESDTQLDEAVNRYVYVWYNHIRPHTYNGGLTPFEARDKD